MCGWVHRLDKAEKSRGVNSSDEAILIYAHTHYAPWWVILCDGPKDEGHATHPRPLPYHSIQSWFVSFCRKLVCPRRRTVMNAKSVPAQATQEPLFGLLFSLLWCVYGCVSRSLFPTVGCSFDGIDKPTLTKLEMHNTLKQTTLCEYICSSLSIRYIYINAFFAAYQININLLKLTISAFRHSHIITLEWHISAGLRFDEALRRARPWVGRDLQMEMNSLLAGNLLPRAISRGTQIIYLMTMF